ncbi:MAG: DUF3516 domain-containing protein, partial [Actinomycetota bacterium]|nr:DUF3516 domain-containing protein [Actinomycetota bacterium]
RQVDSSLIDEWERLQNPEEVPDEVRPQVVDITMHTQAFNVMIRNGAFRWLQLFARADYPGLAASALGGLSDPDSVEDAATAYWDEFDQVSTDADARSSRWVTIDSPGDNQFLVEQIVCDPEGFNEWRLKGFVDLLESREAGEAVMKLTEITRL